MSNDYRPLTGLYKKYWTNEPLANATIIIRLLTNSFTLEAGYPTSKTPGNANDPGRSFQTDENGNLPEGLELFCSGKNVGGATKYRVTEPDNFEWDFILTYGDGSPISMQTLRAGGLPAPNSETVIALIEQYIAAKADKLGTNKTINGTGYTLSADDLGKVIRFMSNAAIILTIPLGLQSGFNCAAIQRGNGQITFVGDDGVIVDNPLNHTKSTKNAVILIYSDAEDSFIFQGVTE